MWVGGTLGSKFNAQIQNKHIRGRGRNGLLGKVGLVETEVHHSTQALARQGTRQMCDRQ